jgi:predicted  nucleic acid-binding Zn-ribbon protein
MPERSYLRDEILLFDLLFDIRRKVRRIEHRLNNYEVELMATIDEVRAAVADATEKMAANTNATEAVVQYVADLKVTIQDLTDKLANAPAGDTAASDEAVAGFRALADSMDADTVRTNALANSDDAPVVDNGGGAPDNGDQPASSARKATKKR